jgi:hypothetical protein
MIIPFDFVLVSNRISIPPIRLAAQKGNVFVTFEIAAEKAAIRSTMRA